MPIPFPKFQSLLNKSFFKIFDLCQLTDWIFISDIFVAYSHNSVYFPRPFAIKSPKSNMLNLCSTCTRLREKGFILDSHKATTGVYWNFLQFYVNFFDHVWELTFKVRSPKKGHSLEFFLEFYVLLYCE